MIAFYRRDPSSMLEIFIVQNIWLTISTQFSPTPHCTSLTSSGAHSTTYTGALAVIDISHPLSNSPRVSQQVYLNVCLILFGSYASVPDNCQLCDLLWSGQLQERKTYEDMFDWLIRKAECVYTSPSWGTDQYLQVWRGEGKR